MTTTLDQVIARLDHNEQAIDDYGAQFAAAAQDLARTANGHACAVIPAPTAWVLLSHVRVGLQHLREALDYLPDGLKRSLKEPAITVTDTDLFTGTARDPETSINQAIVALDALPNTFGDIIANLETAQAAIGAQSWHPIHEL